MTVKDFKLSKNFTLYELLESDIATRHEIKEQFTPPRIVILNLLALCTNVLQPLRDMFGNPIDISSAYRCEEVNRIAGGSLTSQHIKGEAADLKAKHPTQDLKENNKLLFKCIIESKLPFDQLINEFNFSWVHISFSTKRKQRQQVLQAQRNKNGKIVYLPYQLN